jgi:hypothetical protein
VAVDIETTLQELLRQLLTKERFRLPVTIATVGANGSALVTRFTAPPAGTAAGSVEQEHVAGHVDDEGFLAPLRMLATDATGRAKLAVRRRTGSVVLLDTPTD